MVIEAARMLLWVDDIVQATPKDKEQGQGPPPEEMMDGSSKLRRKAGYLFVIYTINSLLCKHLI